MAESMNVVTFDDAGDVVGISRVKRLAKHTDGRIAVVHGDNSGNLTVEPINAKNEPSRTRETWSQVDVAVAFLPTDQQAGVIPNTIPQEVITDAEADTLRTSGLQYQAGGGSRWRKRTGGGFQSKADPRRTVRIAPLLTEVVVGDPQPTLTFTILSGKNPDTTFNTNVFLPVTVAREMHRVRLVFVNGVATLPVKTVRPIEVQIDSTEKVLIEAPIVVRVIADVIG